MSFEFFMDLRNAKVSSGSGVCLGLLLSPSSWPQTNILPGRRPFCLPLRRPKGLVSYMAFPSRFIIRADGSHVLHLLILP